MSDNTTLNSGTGGDTIASDDIGGVKFQRVKLVSGIDGTNDGDSALTNPFPIGIASTPFFPSAGNTSSTNLAAGATFTGTIQQNLNLPSISINVVCDQATLVTVYQSTDAAGLNQIAPIVLPLSASTAGFGASLCVPANSNYYWIGVKNLGSATTLKCIIDVGAGWLWPTTAQGNLPSSINEIGGTALALGQTTTAKSIPVALPSDKASSVSEYSPQMLEVLRGILIEQRIHNSLLMDGLFPGKLSQSIDFLREDESISLNLNG